MAEMLFQVLVTSSALILGILVLRKLTWGRISMRLRYGLWLLVAVRLLVPVSLGTSPVSVMNLFSGMPQVSGQTGQKESRTDWDGAVRTADPAGQETAAARKAEERKGAGAVFFLQEWGQAAAGSRTEDSSPGAGFWHLSRALVVRVVWIMGVLAVGGYLLLSQLRFVSWLRRNRRKLPADGISEEWRERLQKRRMKVYLAAGLPSPCLSGGQIYLGEKAAEVGAELSHILAHEYSHALHGDGFWAFLRCLLVTVYWFDPLVWAAAFAARQDSEYACDEAAVSLLGEGERFAYGRTLLSLLADSGRRECPGMSPMLEGGERSVRDRVMILTKKVNAKKPVALAALLGACLLCGCAFTGAAETDDRAAAGSGQGDLREMAADGGVSGSTAQTGVQDMADGGTADGKEQLPIEGTDGGAAQMQAGDDAAFWEALNYRGVMAGKDDSELFLNRRVDYQGYYEFLLGEGENPLKDGWYLLCENEQEGISIYGLYTEQFGCRGLKTKTEPDVDVNTFDGGWYPTLVNENQDNIRVLERDTNGVARRFVWKLMARESSEVEIWRLYSAYQYDTGTIDLQVLSEEDCIDLAGQHLSFQIEQDAGRVKVRWDGEELPETLDVSAYQDFEIEAVQINPNALGMELASEAYGTDYRDGYEGIVVHLSLGLRLRDSEEIWVDGLQPLTLQLAEEEGGAGFALRSPKFEGRYTTRLPVQERELEQMRSGKAAAISTGSNHLEEPLVNHAEAHHDLEITFRNPCPGYARISDTFGERIHPATGEIIAHNGVDFAAAEGTDVLAAAAGTVYQSGFDAVNGNYVVLWHGDSGQMTYYAHCKDVFVSEGDRVEAGGRIATVGQTGQATGPHLHFAVSLDGEWQKPVWEDG